MSRRGLLRSALAVGGAAVVFPSLAESAVAGTAAWLCWHGRGAALLPSALGLLLLGLAGTLAGRRYVRFRIAALDRLRRPRSEDPDFVK